MYITVLIKIYNWRYKIYNTYKIVKLEKYPI